jgi:hypothetical protein
MLNEENYVEIINGFTRTHWKPLLDLIPEIERTAKFGEMKAGEKDKDGVIQMPFIHASPVVSRFSQIVYDLPIIISFDWGKWHEGREIVNNNNFNFNSIDIPTKCKIITAIVRNDRFCEGALNTAFESGFILKILKSIESQINE